MIKLKNLRDLNEDEFKQIYEYIKEKTSNFTKFKKELIIENNQFLLIIRICLGLSQKEFAKNLNVTKDWCRHTEAGRNKIIHLKVAERYSNKIKDLLKKDKISLEKSLNNYRKYLFFSKNQNLLGPKIRFKFFSQMTEEDLISYFNIVKRETNNFIEFDPNLLIRIPQSLTIFRIILCMSYRKLAETIKMDQSHLRKYEHLKIKMKPTTRVYLINKIEELFKNIDIGNFTINKILENFRILSGFYGNRNLESAIKIGLTRFAKTKYNKFEEEIENILSKNNINYKKHIILYGIKRGFNVDFLIKCNNKKIVLEVFSYSNLKKKSNIKKNVCIVDHRFQALKQKDPNLITIMCIKIRGKPILYDYVKKYFDMELLNTNCLLINNYKEKLVKIINCYYSNATTPSTTFFTTPSMCSRSNVFYLADF